MDVVQQLLVHLRIRFYDVASTGWGAVARQRCTMRRESIEGVGGGARTSAILEDVNEALGGRVG